MHDYWKMVFQAQDVKRIHTLMQEWYNTIICLGQSQQTKKPFKVKYVGRLLWRDIKILILWRAY